VFPRAVLTTHWAINGCTEFLRKRKIHDVPTNQQLKTFKNFTDLLKICPLAPFKGCLLPRFPPLAIFSVFLRQVSFYHAQIVVVCSFSGSLRDSTSVPGDVPLLFHLTNIVIRFPLSVLYCFYLLQHLSYNQVEEDEMGGACSTNGGEEECV
jgi:hypothetical protein